MADFLPADPEASWIINNYLTLPYLTLPYFNLTCKVAVSNMYVNTNVLQPIIGILLDIVLKR